LGLAKPLDSEKKVGKGNSILSHNDTKNKNLAKEI
jgi:hypothetical protein